MAEARAKVVNVTSRCKRVALVKDEVWGEPVREKAEEEEEEEEEEGGTRAVKTYLHEDGSEEPVFLCWKLQ